MDVTPEHLVGECVADGCTRLLVKGNHWRRIPRADRRTLLRQGYAYHHGRQLCGPHYDSARKGGALPDFARLTLSAADLLDEWEHHVGPGLLERPRSHYVRELAPRLGMTPEALERALDRVGVRSTWAGSTWQGRAA